MEERDDDYLIRFTRIHDGDEKTTESSISKALLAVCLKTGYICESEMSVSSVA
jgi:hypothetical protein